MILKPIHGPERLQCQLQFTAAPLLYNKICVVPTNTGEWSGVLQIYDSETDTWSYGKKDVPTITRLPVAAATTGVYAPKRIYVMGGHELPVTGLNQVYDPETDTWSLGTHSAKRDYFNYVHKNCKYLFN